MDDILLCFHVFDSLFSVFQLSLEFAPTIRIHPIVVCGIWPIWTRHFISRVLSWLFDDCWKLCVLQLRCGMLAKIFMNQRHPINFKKKIMISYIGVMICGMTMTKYTCTGMNMNFHTQGWNFKLMRCANNAVLF